MLFKFSWLDDWILVRLAFLFVCLQWVLWVTFGCFDLLLFCVLIAVVAVFVDCAVDWLWLLYLLREFLFVCGGLLLFILVDCECFVGWVCGGFSGLLDFFGSCW